MHDGIEAAHKKLLNAWAKKDMKEVQSYLGQLQVYMQKGQGPSNAAASHTIFRDYYEIRALYCISENNMDQFEHAIKDVHQFYENSATIFGLRTERKSEQQFLMYGLYLMYLLASNNLSEFHMLIEQIDRDKRLNDPFLDVPVNLERYLTEGSYNKITLTEKNLPSPFYKPFINILKQAVQNEIALGLEKAYRTISIADVKKQLFIASEAETLAFGTKRGWLRKGDSFLIGAGKADNKGAKPKLALASGVERDLQPLDSQRIINQCLNYAIQLERII